MQRLERVKEIEFIETVGQLRAALAALADLPDDMPVFDAMGEPVMLTFWRDLDDGSEFIEVV